jgi:hypothetical protein
VSNNLDQALQSFSQLVAAGGAYASGGLQLQVKTNYGPAVTLYNEAGAPSMTGSAVRSLLGLDGGVRILDASGNVVAQFGDWPATDPVRVAVALGVAAALTFGLVKLIRAF